MIRIPPPADELPYGPGNTDYEYDGWRQERDDNAATHGKVAPDSDFRALKNGPSGQAVNHASAAPINAAPQVSFPPDKKPDARVSGPAVAAPE